MATRRYITIFGSIIGEKVSFSFSLSLSQTIDRFRYGIPFRDKHIHVIDFSRETDENILFLCFSLFSFFFFFPSPLFLSVVLICLVRFSLRFSERENIGAPSPPLCSIVADFLLFPRNCRRNDIIARCRDQSPSTSSFHRHCILLCTLSNLSYKMFPHPPRNRCQPGKRLTSATRSIKRPIPT